MPRLRPLAFLLSLVLAGCASELDLIVDVRSDLVAGREVHAVRTELARLGGPVETRDVLVGEGDDLLEGVRAAERHGLRSGLFELRVALLDADGAEVLARRARVDLASSLAVTLVLTSSCLGVECGEGATCVAGQCADVACTTPDGAPCGASECAVDAECTTGVPCGVAACVEGACLDVPDASSCLPLEYCDRDAGCRPREWSAPVPLAELDDPLLEEDDPTLRPDMLELIFVRGTGVSDDLWTTTRASISDPWEPPRPIEELNSGERDTNPMLARDGRTLYFVRANRILVATRAAPGEPWVEGRYLDELNVFDENACPAPSDDQRALLFCGNSGGRDLYLATRADAGRLFSPPVRVDALSSDSDDANGYFGLPGQRVFYFTARRDGSDRDLYVARRDDAADRFGAPTRLDALASPREDENPWLSDDERTIFFASDREGSMTLWSSTR